MTTYRLRMWKNKEEYKANTTPRLDIKKDSLNYIAPRIAAEIQYFTQGAQLSPIIKLYNVFGSGYEIETNTNFTINDLNVNIQKGELPYIVLEAGMDSNSMMLQRLNYFGSFTKYSNVVVSGEVYSLYNQREGADSVTQLVVYMGDGARQFDTKQTFTIKKGDLYLNTIYNKINSILQARAMGQFIVIPDELKPWEGETVTIEYTTLQELVQKLNKTLQNLGYVLQYNMQSQLYMLYKVEGGINTSIVMNMTGSTKLISTISPDLLLDQPQMTKDGLLITVPAFVLYSIGTEVIVPESVKQYFIIRDLNIGADVLAQYNQLNTDNIYIVSSINISLDSHVDDALMWSSTYTLVPRNL